MIIRFFKRGKEGSGAIEYLTNGTLHKGFEVLRDDPEVTKKIIHSLNYSHKYSSGVLCFSEKNVDKNILNEIIDQYETIVFAGLKKDEYNWIVVKHVEKGRTELHFVIPNVNLQLNRSFKPYFHRIDLPLFNAFKDYVNLKYGFSNPNSISRQNTLKKNFDVENAINRMKRTYKTLKEKGKKDSELKELVGEIDYFESREAIKMKITEIISKRIADGLIRSRDDVLRYFNSNDIEVNRIGKDYISVRFEECQKPLRLKGALYGENFACITKLRQSGQPENNSPERDRGIYPKSISKRLSELKHLVDLGIQQRTERFEKQYRVARQRSEERNRRLSENDSAIDSSLHINNYRTNDLSDVHGTEIQISKGKSRFSGGGNNKQQRCPLHSLGACDCYHISRREEKIHSSPSGVLNSKEKENDRVRDIFSGAIEQSRRTDGEIELFYRRLREKVSAIGETAKLFSAIESDLAIVVERIQAIIKIAPVLQHRARQKQKNLQDNPFNYKPEINFGPRR